MVRWMPWAPAETGEQLGSAALSSARGIVLAGAFHVEHDESEELCDVRLGGSGEARGWRCFPWNVIRSEGLLG